MNPNTTLLAQIRQNRIQWRQNRLIGLAPCPYCHNQKTQRNGHRKNGLKLFHCPKCNKSFSERTGTCFHYTRMKSKMDHCASLMTQGYFPLKEMAERLNVSLPTVFEWRHKILSGLKNNPTQFGGTVELQSVELAFSRKGFRGKIKPKRNGVTAKMLILADTNNTTALHLSKIGELTPDDIPQNLNEKLSNSQEIISPLNNVFQQFKSRNQHLPISLHLQESYNLCQKTPQTNMLASQLKSWIYLSMRGVSTKYLANYANWFGFINELTPANIKTGAAQNLNANNFAWGMYAAREKIYHRFMTQKAEEQYVRCFAKEWKTAAKLLLLAPEQDCYS